MFWTHTDLEALQKSMIPDGTDVGFDLNNIKYAPLNKLNYFTAEYSIRTDGTLLLTYCTLIDLMCTMAIRHGSVILMGADVDEEFIEESGVENKPWLHSLVKYKLYYMLGD